MYEVTVIFGRCNAYEYHHAVRIVRGLWWGLNDRRRLDT